MPDLTVVESRSRTDLERLVDDYLASCRARGLSPKTVKEVYGYALRGVLLPFCVREGITSPAQLSNRVMDRLSNELLDGNRSEHTVHSYGRAIKSFLKWAAAEGEAGQVQMQLPKLPKRLIDVLSREQIQTMEDAAISERDKLIVRILADTGIRVGELVGLRVGDLVERDRSVYLKVRGKGSRERLVPVPRLHGRLRRYADRGRPKGTASDRLFLSLRRGAGGDFEPISAHAVEQMIRYLGEKAEVGKRVYPHLLRHSAATWMLQRNMNPMLVAKVLGHSSLAMIQNVYAHLTPDDAYDALYKALLTD